MIKINEFVILVGPAGSGKSTVANNLSNHGYQVVSSDAIRKELYGSEQVLGNPTQVFGLVGQRIRDLLADGKNVVMDATNLVERRRKSFLASLPTGIKKIAVVVATPPEQIYKQNAYRDRCVPKEIIHRQIAEFQTPSVKEGFDEVHVVHNGSLSLSDIHEKCRIPHDNPHHVRNVEDHMVSASRAAKRDGCSDVIVNTLLHHDIGKPFTKIMDAEGVAHYIGHQGYGAYILLCTNIDDCLQLSWYVTHHMDLFSTSVEKLQKKYGVDSAYILSMINQYDKEFS